MTSRRKRAVVPANKSVSIPRLFGVPLEFLAARPSPPFGKDRLPKLDTGLSQTGEATHVWVVCSWLSYKAKSTEPQKTHTHTTWHRGSIPPPSLSSAITWFSSNLCCTWAAGWERVPISVKLWVGFPRALRINPGVDHRNPRLKAPFSSNMWLLFPHGICLEHAVTMFTLALWPCEVHSHASCGERRKLSRGRPRRSAPAARPPLESQDGGVPFCPFEGTRFCFVPSQTRLLAGGT